MSLSSQSFDEARLQQELRQMFELDSQKDLEAYFACLQQSNDWEANIQAMYRAIHTIKGGSVTVKADAILEVATALEDLLSDLRYFDAPVLPDEIRQMLVEAGELLASVMGVAQAESASATAQKVERIQTLHQQIQQNYLADWSEQRQVQKEFAEQGFDLVVLDLEIALGQLDEVATVPEATKQQAQELIQQLRQIGQELELAPGWSRLLDEAEQLQTQSDAAQWRYRWQQLLPALKSCADNGGEINYQSDQPLELAVSSLELPISDSSAAEINLDEIDGILNNLEDNQDQSTSDLVRLDEIDSILDNLEQVELDKGASTTNRVSLDQIDQIVENIEPDGSQSASDLVAIERLDNLESVKADTEALSPTQTTPLNQPIAENIQIPVPLTRLDDSAQSIVETLLAARATESFYQNLHQDLLKLIAIASDSVQYITQLRKIQDDYAGVSQLEDSALQLQNRASLNTEKYHKGYVTINRLLENSLRLTEISTEAEQNALKTAQQLKQLNNHILRLKDTIEDSRLVPFKNIAFRVRAILRDLINRYHKSVHLSVIGEQIELDVGTARRLEPILLHLVRNAFDHGIEAPQTRRAAGKPEAGKLTLTLQRTGENYQLKLEDDGKGIDTESVRTQAQRLALPLTQTDTPEELLSVISQPGFSSKNQASDISGRGVGMNVVAEEITRLGGYLSLTTKLGQGTTFKLDFPVPHLLVPCLMVQAGDRAFAIPTEQVVTTAVFTTLKANRVKSENLRYEWEIPEEKGFKPGLDLLSYWIAEYRPDSPISNAVSVLIRAGDSEIWLIGDRLLGQLELQIKPLPSPIIAPPGVLGVALQADGSLMPVIDAGALIDYVQTTATPNANASRLKNANIASFQPQQPTILIVDDAALMRRRIEASLSSYTTHTCADGLEAWKWLQKNPHPILVITDIEMPHMDGFTLIDRCRQANFAFPILVVSSRLAEEWSSESRRLGATDYLTKGFSTSELINKVNALID